MPISKPKAKGGIDTEAGNDICFVAVSPPAELWHAEGTQKELEEATTSQP